MLLIGGFVRGALNVIVSSVLFSSLVMLQASIACSSVCFVYDVVVVFRCDFVFL